MGISIEYSAKKNPHFILLSIERRFPLLGKNPASLREGSIYLKEGFNSFRERSISIGLNLPGWRFNLIRRKFPSLQERRFHLFKREDSISLREKISSLQERRFHLFKRSEGSISSREERFHILKRGVAFSSKGSISSREKKVPSP